MNKHLSAKVFDFFCTQRNRMFCLVNDVFFQIPDPKRLKHYEAAIFSKDVVNKFKL
jgi:hypothetical protein